MDKHSNDAAIREQAYYFWEQDGKPHGRDNEYWQRAVVAVSEKSQMDSLVKPAPRKAAKPVAKAATKPAPKTPVKLKAAASTAKSEPAKSTKAAAKPADKAKPKKK